MKLVVKEKNYPKCDIKSTDLSIVFDLDATLINTFSDMKALNGICLSGKNSLKDRLYNIELHDVIDMPGDGVYSKMWGVFRPGWPEFYDFIKKYFKYVFIWSAGQPRYVDSITNLLFPDPDFQPVLVYTYDDCKFGKKSIFKPLSLMMSDDLMPKDVGYHNLFIVDDRKDTFSKNKDNGILIPIYGPKSNNKSIRNCDTALKDLISWLSTESVMCSPDVRKLDKTKIFKSKQK